MPFDPPTLEGFAVTAIVAAVRVFVEASPSLLAGIIAAALLRTLATPERVAAMFKGTGWAGFRRTALIGMTAPVCALGALPILRELRRLGLPTPKLLILAFVTPLLNPVSLIGGLTTFPMPIFLLIVVAAVTIAAVATGLGGQFLLEPVETPEAPPRGLTSGTRLRNLLVAAGRIATGWTLLDLGLVIAAAAVAGSLLTAESFDALCRPSNRVGAAGVGLLMLPQYVSPVSGIMYLAAAQKAGFSVAAGLTVFVVGIAFSPATLLWAVRWFGWRRATALTLAVVVSAFAVVAVGGVLIPAPVSADPEGTHAFDNVTVPLRPQFSALGGAISRALSLTAGMTVGGTAALAILIVTGLAVRRMKLGYRD
ncbi:MAG: permease, partial [Planctomycetota bacterium]